MSDYPWKTPPFSHQREWWEKTRALPAWGILWEQGTGKSKLTVDTAAWLYLNKRIEGLVIIAPNGVYRNWTVNELPTHLPDVVAEQTKSLLWETAKASTKRFQAAAKEVQEHRGLAVLVMSYHGIMTEAGDKFLHKFLTERRCMMVLDESARIKEPRVKWTIRSLARGKAAVFRRILTGTPVANSPFDVFTQFAFLHPDIWDSIGCRAYAAFKNYFGVFASKMDPRSGRLYQDLVRYRNLNKLGEMTQAVSCRVLKDDVLDLPPKLYTKRYFTMSAEQARAYEDMKESYLLRFESGEVDAMLAIVQLLRFQQIVSGFVPTRMEDGSDGPVKHFDNPRLRLLREIVEDTPGKFIVWAKFRQDIDSIMAALKEDGVEAVRFDGAVGDEERAEAIVRFQTGTARAFVANPAVGAEGITLTAARTVIYYNNSFKLTDRLQSEDRAHRIGQRNAVTYFDLVATDTVDEKIVEALRNKVDIASVITGDKLKEWI